MISIQQSYQSRISIPLIYFQRFQINLVYFFSKTISMLHRQLSRVLFKFSEVYPNNPNLSSKSGTFQASKLVKNLKKQPSDLPEFKAEQLLFGKHNSDHMISVDWQIGSGWGTPSLIPFADLQLHPFSSALHYGIQCFEGLKAYRNDKGEVRLFRPWCNALRLKRSSLRLTLPDFDGGELLKLIDELLKAETRWIPPQTEFSLYVRPLHIATDNALGVHSPNKSKLLVMTGPVGPYYPTGFKPIRLYCATEHIRSAPKGTGSFKIGGNYAPTLQASTEVASRGYQQALWLLGQKIIEVGSSNIFFVFKDKSGQIEVATPLLEDLILPGITRDSIVQLLRHEGKYKVSEREIFITEVIERHKKGELLEVFGAGTAVIVSGVKEIHYKGVDYAIPVDKQLGIGQISFEIRKKLLDIQEGRSPDVFNWVHRVV